MGKQNKPHQKSHRQHSRSTHRHGPKGLSGETPPSSSADQEVSHLRVHGNSPASHLPPASPISLSPKEKRVLEFLENCIRLNGVAPSFQEIREEFGFASFNSVQNYLKQLTQKGYIELSPYQKRSIRILQSASIFAEHVHSLSGDLSGQFLGKVSTAGSSNTSLLQAKSETLSLPLLGSVAAGLPLEAHAFDDFLEVTRSMVRNPQKSYALKVKGNSMIDDGIFDGDYLIVQDQSTAERGDIVIASIEGEATVKRYYPIGSESKLAAQSDSHKSQKNGVRQIELRPSNPQFRSQFYPADRVQIKGVLVGLIRKFGK